jgi:hypothetical protein
VALDERPLVVYGPASNTYDFGFQGPYCSNQLKCHRIDAQSHGKPPTGSTNYHDHARTRAGGYKGDLGQAGLADHEQFRVRIAHNQAFGVLEADTCFAERWIRTRVPDRLSAVPV